MNENNYFYEAGAVQEHTSNGPIRVIEGEHSARDARKVPQDLCIKITHALNNFDNGYIPSDEDLAAVEKRAEEMIDQDIYGGGVIKGLVDACRRHKAYREMYEKKIVG